MVRFQETLDSRAFDEIVSLYMSPALAVAKRILCDNSLAEDAVQETFLKLICKRGQYIPSKPFSNWFYTILRNVCIDMLRKKSRHSKAIEEIAQQGKHVTQQFQEFEATDLLDTLAPTERDVIWLRVIHGLSFRDIAAALGISYEAAKKRGQRGLRHLRKNIFDSKISSRKLCSLSTKEIA